MTRQQIYIHLCTCPVRIKMEGPPFKTTTLHRPFDYGQRAPLVVRTKANTSRTRPESQQKGEWS